MTKKSDRQIRKRIGDWQKKKDDAKPKSLEHGIADNNIAKLQNALVMDEDQMKEQIKKAEQYVEECKQSKVIMARKIKNMENLNARLKQKRSKQRWNVPDPSGAWEIEKIPLAMIKEMQWVMG